MWTWIFSNMEKKICFQKYLDTCGRGPRLVLTFTMALENINYLKEDYRDESD